MSVNPQEDNNTCPTCGGAKAVRYEMEIVPAGIRPKVNPASRLKLCTCPLPRPVHDGKLEPMKGEEYVAEVSLFDDNPATSLISISGGYVVAEEAIVYLDPKQALSLLDWLKQNEAKLQELAQAVE